MGKFLKYTILFLLPIIIIIGTVEVLLRRIPNDYINKKHYLDKNAGNIKVLILGNSHAMYGVNPRYLTYKSYNAAYIAQSMDYDYGIYKKYNDRLDNLKYIVMPVAYFSFYIKLASGIESWREKNYDIYYGVHVKYKVSNNFEVFSNNLDVIKKRLDSYYRQKISNLTCDDLGWGTLFNSKIKYDKNLDSTGRHSAAIHTAKDTTYYTEQLQCLKNIIELAQSHHVKVILYTSPAYKSYYDNLNPVQLTNTLNTLNTVAHTYSNVSYHNLLKDSSFTADDFYDGDHLNDVGAKKLTAKIDSIIVHGK